MKRFSFRLEQVRRWRQEQADAEEMRLGQLHAERRRVQEEQQEIAAVADQARRKVLAQPSITAGELTSLEAFHDYAQYQIQRLKLKEAELEKRINEQRQRVLEAHRSFQLLDGLRDKALLAWTATRDKEQDELGTELYLAQLGKGKRTRKPAP